MERPARSRGRHARFERVVVGRRHRHGVFQPFAACGVGQRVAAAAIHCRHDVDIGLPILSTRIAWRQIVVSDALASIVEVLRFDETRNRRGAAAEWRRARRRENVNGYNLRDRGGADVVGRDSGQVVVAGGDTGP